MYLNIVDNKEVFVEDRVRGEVSDATHGNVFIVKLLDLKVEVKVALESLSL